MFEATDSQIRKAIVALAIEETLLEMGKPAFDQITTQLWQEHHCYLPDCYEHPEYLKNILSELYGASHITIVESIKVKLRELTYEKPIAEFVKVMAR